MEIEMMFGWAWGNEYKDWTPFMVSTNDIATEIDKAEQSGAGNFYNDDTFFYLKEWHCQILFCHEFDIHLDFDENNNLVDDIIGRWKKKRILN